MIRAHYKVADRIQVSQFTGDVVEISYFDTTLWEFAGSYMTNDLPSGRLIRFPNSLVFQDEIYNYSSQKSSYIWNESFHVAYQSDLDGLHKPFTLLQRKNCEQEWNNMFRSFVIL